MRLAVPDLISPSYFPAIAAVQLGLMRQEGLDVELELDFPVTRAVRMLRGGEVDFVAGAAHTPSYDTPDWEGVRLLCGLSRYMYWFLVVRPDAMPADGDLRSLRDLTIGAAPGPDLGLAELFRLSGVDTEHAGLAIVPPPAGNGASSISFGVAAAQSLAAGRIDAFWANGMGADVAVREGVGKVLIDARRMQTPVRSFTFPALMTTTALIRQGAAQAAAAIRAIARAQQLLAAIPGLAREVGEALFPPKEAALIEAQIARDVPYYSPAITRADTEGINQFVTGAGLAQRGVRFEAMVATEFMPLWQAGREDG